MPLPPGPLKQIQLDQGHSMPFYVIPFDKKGRCQGPLTREHLIQDVTDNAYTDLFFVLPWVE